MPGPQSASKEALRVSFGRTTCTDEYRTSSPRASATSLLDLLPVARGVPERQQTDPNAQLFFMASVLPSPSGEHEAKLTLAKLLVSEILCGRLLKGWHKRSEKSAASLPSVPLDWLRVHWHTDNERDASRSPCLPPVALTVVQDWERQNQERRLPGCADCHDEDAGEARGPSLAV